MWSVTNGKISRRCLLVGSAALPLGVSALAATAADGPRWTVGVIGHTGRGNYGHGLDKVWLSLPEAKIVAVADPNADGLGNAMQRLQVDSGYADYRDMLRKHTPQIVAICPRHPDQHRDMALAAIQAGARGLYIEKPFCRNPAEADQILTAADARDVKIAVAHRNRYLPELELVRDWIRDGRLGRVLEMRGRGKGDRRGGVEDLWVLGSHVLNLMHFLGGKPRSCAATILQDDREITADDLQPGNEALGRMAGNRLHSRFLFQDGRVGYFDSIADDATDSEGFGLRVIGSEGVIDMKCDRFPFAYVQPGNPWDVRRPQRDWQPLLVIDADAAGRNSGESLRAAKQAFDDVMSHRAVAADLINAMVHRTQPLCDGASAAMTIEMITAVMASHVAHGRATPIPLEDRGQPFDHWQNGGNSDHGGEGPAENQD